MKNYVYVPQLTIISFFIINEILYVFISFFSLLQVGCKIYFQKVQFSYIQSFCNGLQFGFFCTIFCYFISSLVYWILSNDNAHCDIVETFRSPLYILSILFYNKCPFDQCEKFNKSVYECVESQIIYRMIVLILL